MAGSRAAGCCACLSDAYTNPHVNISESSHQLGVVCSLSKFKICLYMCMNFVPLHKKWAFILISHRCLTVTPVVGAVARGAV